MTIILVATILIFIVSIIWTWHNLGFIEKSKKIAFIAIGILVMYIITSLIFIVSKSGVNYPNEEIEGTVKNTLVMVFTGLNTLILLPYLAKILDGILEEEIEKEEATKKVIIILIVFLICIFIESGYLTDTQKGILNMYSEVQNAKT